MTYQSNEGADIATKFKQKLKQGISCGFSISVFFAQKYIRRSFSNCYGCAVNGAENSVLLLRALSSITTVRDELINEGIVLKLLESPVNLGSTKLRKLVRRALCRLVRGSERSSSQLGRELKKRIIYTATQNQRNPALARYL